MVRLAINGFGRIGRNAFKLAFANPELEVVAINDPGVPETLAHLLKHDSNYGRYAHEVKIEDGALVVAGKKIILTAEREPQKLPWAEHKIDVVIESTGHFTDGEAASLHLKAGAKRVVISAPAKSGDAKVKTFVIGANADQLDDTSVISNASCTTNCIAPLMRILQDAVGVEKSLMTTVHSYTASQVLQDGPAKDLRESRSAAENIVPTTTGAAIAAALTVPELQGKFDGMSVRVPTPVVSLSDITFVAARDTTVEEVNSILRRASESSHRGIVAVTTEELVSADYKGNPHSAIVDSKLTNVVGGNLVKVVAWYDNEWGYSNRLVEMAVLAGKHNAK